MLEASVLSWGYAEGVEGRAGFADYLGTTLFERRMQWQGTRDISAWLTVPGALEFQARHEWPQVRARCHALAKEALDVLTRRFGTQALASDQDWAQMVAILVAHKDPAALQRRLFEESRIEVPVTSHGDQVFVRISVQGYNTPQDIEQLLSAAALH